MVITGTLGYDTITTPWSAQVRGLGGPVAYASLAARLFTEVEIVASAGSDFDLGDLIPLTACGIGTKHVEVRADAATYHWTGHYAADGNCVGSSHITKRVYGRRTARVARSLQEAATRARVVVLATMPPQEQCRCLAQLHAGQLVVAGTDLAWIQSAPQAVRSMLAAVDIVVMTASELCSLVGVPDVSVAASALLVSRPQVIVTTHAEAGAEVLEHGRRTHVPASRTTGLVDPTGAGDAFVGAFAGFMDARAKATGTLAANSFAQAAAYASAAGSIAVEGVGIDAIANVTAEDVVQRATAIWAEMQA